MAKTTNKRRAVRTLKTARTIALLASTGIAFQAGCLGQLESGLDLLAAPSAISNALHLPYSPLLDISKFLLRFWF